MPLNLTVPPFCIFISAIPLISNFIFWPFTTVALIFHSPMLVKLLFMYWMYVDVKLYPNYSSKSSLLLLLYITPHNMALTKKIACNISFLFIFRPTINFHVTLISKVVTFFIEARLSLNIVFIYPSIGQSVAIFSTIIAHAFDELAIVLLYFSSI